MVDSVCWVALLRRNGLRRRRRVSVYLYGGEPCKNQKKPNGNGDLRYFAGELIRSGLAVTPVRRDVEIKLGVACDPHLTHQR